MKPQNFEKELPLGYSQVYSLNAKNVKIGIIFNLLALAIMLAVFAVATVLFVFFGEMPESPDFIYTHVTLFVTLILLFAYLVLHELIHGAAYKLMTGEKLTFGVSWSCAYCGVPNIYTYRKTALIALVSPLVVFSAILTPLICIALFVSAYMYFALVLLFASHLGGCIGDIYVTFLLLAKYKDKRMLMRDTGPEQFFYLPSEKEN